MARRMFAAQFHVPRRRLGAGTVAFDLDAAQCRSHLQYEEKDACRKEP
jgi:hypothetical protein